MTVTVISPYTRQQLMITVPPGVMPGSTFMVADGSLMQGI